MSNRRNPRWHGGLEEYLTAVRKAADEYEKRSEGLSGVAQLELIDDLAAIAEVERDNLRAEIERRRTRSFDTTSGAAGDLRR